ncbi:MAG: hypothetical protein E7266_10555 [Lachnospiraceae bacterium]|nr:hypothetical protein [Lachnospiraceae bacterium]
MKVKKLIDLLIKQNPEAVVKMHSKDDEPVLFVVNIVGDDSVVWLESESDNDMTEEISARLETAIDENIDEFDFYEELLELGIDVNMMRKYLGDEAANHMEKFCYEHGLI